MLDLQFSTKKDKFQSDKLGVVISKLSLLIIYLKYNVWVLTIEKIIYLALSKLWAFDSFSALSVFPPPKIMPDT